MPFLHQQTHLGRGWWTGCGKVGRSSWLSRLPSSRLPARWNARPAVFAEHPYRGSIHKSWPPWGSNWHHLQHQCWSNSMVKGLPGPLGNKIQHPLPFGILTMIRCLDGDSVGLEKQDAEEVDTKRLDSLWDANPLKFVAFSTIFSLALTLGAIFMGNFAGLDVLKQLRLPYNISYALLWCAPMVLALVGIVSIAEYFESLRKLKSIFQKSLVPTLAAMPAWGRAVVALGAGISEEAFFRAFLQTALISELSKIAGAKIGSVAGLGVTSIMFGLSHSITPLYFWWATGAGVVLGVEYLYCGLASTATTHFIYDWVAFVFIIRVWGSKSTSENSK